MPVPWILWAIDLHNFSWEPPPINGSPPPSTRRPGRSSTNRTSGLEGEGNQHLEDGPPTKSK